MSLHHSHNFPSAYRLAVMLDTGATPDEAAARAGMDRDEARRTMREIEHMQGPRGASIVPLTANEAVVMHYMGHTTLQAGGNGATPLAPDIARALGTTLQEIELTARSLERKGMIRSAGDPTAGTGEEAGEDHIPSHHWEGPSSSLALALANMEDPEKDEPDSVIQNFLSIVCQKRTTRILLTENQSARVLMGPNPGEEPLKPTTWDFNQLAYVELAEPVTSPLRPQELALHGLILIPPVRGRKRLGTMIPLTGDNEVRTMMAELDVKTGQAFAGENDTPLELPSQDPFIGLFIRTVNLVSDPSMRLRERRLNRVQRRRLRNSGIPNPWRILTK